MIYIFFRLDDKGVWRWYPIEIKDPSDLRAHIDSNPGTIRVEDIDGNELWSKDK